MMILNTRGKQCEADRGKVVAEERELPQHKSVKYLGVKIDRQLKWHLHIDRVRQLCMAKLALIRSSAAFYHQN